VDGVQTDPCGYFSHDDPPLPQRPLVSQLAAPLSTQPPCGSIVPSTTGEQVPATSGVVALFGPQV
jgi:hypothetical protein